MLRPEFVWWHYKILSETENTFWGAEGKARCPQSADGKFFSVGSMTEGVCPVKTVSLLNRLERTVVTSLETNRNGH